MEPDAHDGPYGHLIQPLPGAQEPGPDPLQAIASRAGEALGIADGTVRKHLEEARETLRQALGPVGG